MYCVLATPIDNEDQTDEAISSEDNLSCVSIEGLPDLAVTQLELSDGDPQAGDTVDVAVSVTNYSGQSLGPFNVSLYQGDPSVPSLPTKQVAMQTVPSLSGFAGSDLVFQWIVPDTTDPDYAMTGGQSGVGRGLGHFVLTAVVDEANMIGEAVEGNNSQSRYLDVLPEVALEGGAMAVQASLINHAGIDNVQVTLHVTNHGAASATQVTVALETFLNDQRQEDPPAPIVIPLLAPGETMAVSLVADGLAGLNRYQTVITSDFDANLSNNVGQTTLVVQGLPDLVPTGILLSDETPRQGDALFVRSNIANLGIAAADAIRVEVFAGAGEPANYGLLLGSTVIDHMDPLGSALAEVSVDTSLMDGEQNLCVVIDRPEHVFEQNDRNNAVCMLAHFEAAENEPPTIELPGSFSVISGVDSILAGIQIADSGAGDDDVELKLRADFGGMTVRLDIPGGVVPGQVAGNSTIDVKVTASIAAINTTLAADGLSYRSGPGFIGEDLLRIVVDDRDTGPSGPKTIEVHIPIYVTDEKPQDIDTLSQLIQQNEYEPTYDFDSDNDVDRDDLRFYVTEVLHTNFGDATLDGVFNSSDLVAVFQKGRYEDSRTDDVTWAEGDWNADGRFNSSDLVRAFQAGAYTRAAAVNSTKATSAAPARKMQLEPRAADHIFGEWKRICIRRNWTPIGDAAYDFLRAGLMCEESGGDSETLW